MNAEKIDINLYKLNYNEQWVETFGMTLLEGMQYGLPAIAPPVGGCTEFIETNVNGYQIDQRNLPLIIEKINALNSDKELYQQLSTNAAKKATIFNVEQMCQRIAMITLLDAPFIVA